MAETKIHRARNGKIDFLRLLFAFIIVLHHTRYLLGDDHCLFLGGSLSVEFFFFVSGCLMAASADRKMKAAGAAGKTSGKTPASAEGLGTETAHFLKKKLSAVFADFLTAWIIGFFFVAAAEKLSLRGMAGLFVRDFFELGFLKMSGLYIGGLDGVVWYVSAMLLSMAVLYPLLRKFPDFFPKIVCPLVCIFIMGFLCRNYGHPRNPDKWIGFAYKGLLRALAELCLGVVIYQISRKMQRTQWTRAARVLFTVFEAAAYLSFIAYMYYYGPTEKDFFFIALLAAAVTLSFAGTGLLSKRFDGRGASWCARFSTSLYFSHLYYAQHLNQILPQSLSAVPRVLVYLAFAFGTALFVMYFSDFIRSKKNVMKSWFVKAAA